MSLMKDEEEDEKLATKEPIVTKPPIGDKPPITTIEPTPEDTSVPAPEDSAPTGSYTPEWEDPDPYLPPAYDPEFDPDIEEPPTTGEIDPDLPRPDDIVPLPKAYDNPMTRWDINNKVKYKDGVLSYQYRQYDPIEWAAYAKANPDTEHDNDPFTIRNHLLLALALQFDDQGWLEQLSMDAKDTIDYYDKKCFRKMNGMTVWEAYTWMPVFWIDTTYQLDIRVASNASWKAMAICGNTYRPQSMGENFMNFPINALYIVVGAYILPQLIQALPVLIKTFPDMAEGLVDLVKWGSHYLQKFTGVTK